MKKFLEKIVHTIVPHQKNGNVPHILREEFIFVLIIFIGVLFYFNQNNFDIIKKLKLSATVYPAVLADLANQDRNASDVPELTWSPTLEQAAKLKAEDMAENGYFAHTSPNGITPWHWLSKVDYNFLYAGENLAIDFTESANVENAWINSPKHKENIMNSHFTEIGIATVDGFFEGKNTTFVVEFFGTPSKILTPEEITPVKKIAVENTNKIVKPSVAGATTENIPKENIIQEPKVKVIEETDKLITVKNENATEEQTPTIVENQNIKPMSTWYERFIISPTKTIKTIYFVILGLILLSMILMLSKEYQKHHTKHLILGIILIVIILALTFIIN